MFTWDSQDIKERDRDRKGSQLLADMWHVPRVYSRLEEQKLKDAHNYTV